MSEVRISLIFSKADWCSGSQFQVVPFFSRGRMVLVICARSGMNEPSWVAGPKNALTSLLHDGIGNCLIAANFFSSGLIPVSEMMCPVNSISFPISIFFA